MTPAPRPNLRRAGILLLALYVVAGAIYSCVLPAVGRFPDERDYLAIADHLLHGPGFSVDGAHLTAFRPPGYPFFLAAIGAMGGGVVAMRICQFLLTGGIVLLVARLFPERDRPVALIATTAVVGLYPLFFYTSATLYPQTLAAFLFVLALTVLVCPRRAWLGTLGLGVIFGFLCLVVPTFLLTLLVVLAMGWWWKIIRVPEGALVLVITLLVVGTWTARNFVAFHEFVPVASNSGVNLLIGNSENTTPTAGSANVDLTRYTQEAQARGLDEIQEDRYYRQAAITWIEQNPGRAFILYLEKTACFFSVYNQYASANHAEMTPWRQVALGVSYALLLVLLAWRLMEMKRFPLSTTEKLFLAVYVLSAFTSAIFFQRIRYRLPFDYLIVAIIAMHLARRLERCLTGRG